jgi:serine/threonine-protein kinase
MPELDRLTTALAGRYDVEREIGHGGMARVLLARDRKHDRPVAIKVVHSDIAAGIAAERFLREIQISARLTHPHILPLLDSGYAADLPYYVMPFVDGESIRDRLRRVGRFPVDEAVHYVREVADALDYAHAAGVLHRDVKPENVLLLGTHAIVLDFGVGRAISAATDDEAGITMAGIVVGTPAYLSPEQAAGETTLDGRSDQYALATMLYEMIAGETPFRGATPQATIAKRFMEAAPPLDAARPDAPPHVVTTVARALARDQADRFETVGSFGAALAGGTVTGVAAAVPARPEPPSIAVVPFANVGGKPDDEFLADGITDEVISSLSRMRTLRVAARTSSYAIRGSGDDAAAIGARLKVESLVEGSVQRAGNRVRVKARLVHVADGFQRWADQFDREADDVFAIQDAISAAIARALEATILGGDGFTRTPASPANPAAYERYLKGRYFWGKRTDASLTKAVDFFTDAIAADPNYAPAYAGLADAYAALGVYGLRDPRDVMPRARAHAERALAIDPARAEVHATLAYVCALYDHDWAAAEAGFARALTLDPSCVIARQWRAIALLGPLGRFAEAIADADRARAQDPLSLVVACAAAAVRSFGGDPDAALVVYDEVHAIEPGFWLAYYFRASSELRRGRPRDAVASAERAIALSGGSDEQRARLAVARAAAGEADLARGLLAELEAGRGARYVSPARIAWVHAALGAPDVALEWLRTAETEHDPELVYLHVRTEFAPLHPHPEFVALGRRLGLPPIAR